MPSATTLRGFRPASSRRLALFAAGMLSALGAHALPVTVTTPFMNLENRGINSLGFSTGQVLRIGADSVVPNVLSGTTAIGTTVNQLTGATVTQTIPSDASPLTPNMIARQLADTPALRGPWTMTFTNGSNVTQTVVSLSPTATQAPFVNTITLSGTSANPTFTWAPPPGTVVNGYRLNIFDKALINNNPANGPTNSGQVASVNVAPNVTSHTVSAADFSLKDYGFQLDHNYSIQISLLQTKDGGSTNLGNGNLQAIARSYADFTPTAGTSPIVNLPVVLANGSFQFDIAVVPGQTYFIDPAVATGYDFATGAGDPNFASVVLPGGIGDGLYDIYGFDAAGNASMLAHDWAAGSVFDFAGAGVDRFRVGGIETSAGIDPASTTAFVTGLSFEGAGSFTGTQTPLVADIAAAVPEPEVWTSMLAGVGAIGALWRRRSVASLSSAAARPPSPPAPRSRTAW